MYNRQISLRSEFILDGNAMVIMYRISKREAVLIDSGQVEDEDLIIFLNKRNIRIRTVLHTHLHTDHIANDALLIRHFNPDIYAGERELRTMRTRELYPTERGIHTPQFIDRFMKMLDFEIIPAIHEQGVQVDNNHFDMILLPGHTIGHVGYITPDGICCLGDALLSEAVLQRSRFPFLVDVKSWFETLDRIPEIDCEMYAVAHHALVKKEDIEGLVHRNRRHEIYLLERVKKVMQESISDQEAEDTLFKQLDHGQFDQRREEVMRFTIRARISYIHEMNY